MEAKPERKIVCWTRKKRPDCPMLLYLMNIPAGEQLPEGLKGCLVGGGEKGPIVFAPDPAFHVVVREWLASQRLWGEDRGDGNTVYLMPFGPGQKSGFAPQPALVDLRRDNFTGSLEVEVEGGRRLWVDPNAGRRGALMTYVAAAMTKILGQPFVPASDRTQFEVVAFVPEAGYLKVRPR